MEIKMFLFTYLVKENKKMYYKIVKIFFYTEIVIKWRKEL